MLCKSCIPSKAFTADLVQKSLFVKKEKKNWPVRTLCSKSYSCKITNIK
jgi:hypothetical protein